MRSSATISLVLAHVQTFFLLSSIAGSTLLGTTAESSADEGSGSDSSSDESSTTQDSLSFIGKHLDPAMLASPQCLGLADNSEDAAVLSTIISNLMPGIYIGVVFAVAFVGKL